MLISNNQLTQAQWQAVEQLAEQCRTIDGSLLPVYPSILAQKRLTDNNILYFQNNHLLGFLSVYFFYSNACELCVMVAPSHRRKGIARQLIQQMMPLLIAKQIDSVIFSTPATCHDTWLAHLGLRYHHSEYQMQREGSEPVIIARSALTVRQAVPSDKAALCVIDDLCFSEEETNMELRFTSLLADPHYTLLLALHDEQAVGKAHIRWQTNSAILSDIAIIPLYQGQGWGKELVASCINLALAQGKTKLILDVETSNHNALRLYTLYDFKVNNSVDFWSASLNQLALYLKTN